MVIFAMLVTLAPLAFGAVDRIVQIVLVLLLAAGVIASPPATGRLGQRGRIFGMVILGMFVVKEFAPHAWFGEMKWREEAAGSLGLAFPWTHHPEPVRALDWLLIAAVAVIFLQWVRTLSADRSARITMAWILFLAGATVALLCFAMGSDSKPGGAIYGFRNTPGWSGWGPFPNRNHTASFLAMSAIMGAGCTVWGIAKRRKSTIITGSAVCVLIIIALLSSRSRGGLVAFGTGLAGLSVLLLWRHRDRRAATGIVTGLVLVVVCVAVFGTEVIGRFEADHASQMSNQGRIEIWRNAFEMWKAAPLFGHGVETFNWLFPFYQSLKLDDNVVLHPESSWMKSLTELGVVPLALICVPATLLVRQGLRFAFARRDSFHLIAAAFAGVAAIVVHSVVDVPAHRWGTAGYALALLGLACPVPSHGEVLRRMSARVGFVPLAIALFWSLPFIDSRVSSQPIAAEILKGREASGGLFRPEPADWECALRYFPLERALHHFAAMRELESGAPKSGAWQKHFEIVHRLVPGGWRYPISHARAVQRISPTLCIAYWQLAIDRSDRRGPELLGEAVRETSNLPRADSLWADYISANPKLALAYAKLLPGDEGRAFYETWWEKRGQAGDLTAEEVRFFYDFATRWATPEQIDTWIRTHANRRTEDGRKWIIILHSIGQHERAWALYAQFVPEPAYPQRADAATVTEVESRVRLAPSNAAHVLDLAHVLELSGHSARAREIILAAAEKKDAAAWFLRKGAYLLAADGQFRDATAMALREKLEPHGGGGAGKIR